MAERREVKAPEKVDIQMTPMIDIVFQLMAFFLMTFKVATVEGDFDLRLPRPDHRPGTIGMGPERVEVRLTAAADGELASLRIGNGPPHSGRDVPSPFRVLRELLARKSAEARAAGQEEAEIEIDADDGLRYEHIIATIEAAQPEPGTEPRKIRFGKRER